MELNQMKCWNLPDDFIKVLGSRDAMMYHLRFPLLLGSRQEESVYIVKGRASTDKSSPVATNASQPKGGDVNRLTLFKTGKVGIRLLPFNLPKRTGCQTI